MAEMLYLDFFMVKLVFLSDIRYNQTWRDGGNILSKKIRMLFCSVRKGDGTWIMN